MWTHMSAFMLHMCVPHVSAHVRSVRALTLSWSLRYLDSFEYRVQTAYRLISHRSCRSFRISLDIVSFVSFVQDIVSYRFTRFVQSKHRRTLIGLFETLVCHVRVCVFLAHCLNSAHCMCVCVCVAHCLCVCLAHCLCLCVCVCVCVCVCLARRRGIENL
jgi:hypothetical protein